MSAEFQEHPLDPKGHFQAEPLFKMQHQPPIPEEYCDNQEPKPKIESKPRKYLQHHLSSNFNMYLPLHTNKRLRPPNSRECMTEMHRKILLEQEGSQERKTEKTICMEKTVQTDETEPDVILEQGDELGCGDELAQGIDLDLVEGLEESETSKSEDEEESMDLLSDSCSKKEVDDNVSAEQIQVEDVGKIAWGLTKNGVSTSHESFSDVQMASNTVYGCITHRDRILYDKICTSKTFVEEFYPDGIIPGRMFSSEEDIDGLFPDICDAGEALADKDGLSECDLFEQTEPLQITETEDNVSGDIMMLITEDGSNSSDLSSTSIEEEDEEMQVGKEKMEEKGNNYLSDKSASQNLSAIDSPDCPSSNSGGETLLESDQISFSNSSSSQPFSVSGSDGVSDGDVADANQNYCSKYVADHDEAVSASLNFDVMSALSLVQQQPETQGQSLQHNQDEESIGEEKEVASDHLSISDGKELAADHVYEETEPKVQAKDFLQNRKYFMTRSISVETPSTRVDLMTSPAPGNGRLLLHPRSFYTDQCFLGDSRPALTGSLGCLSQGTSNLAKVTRVDIPPPFELASITKRPIRKSSPSLPNEISASCKKPDFGFKRYLLPLRFLRKSDRKSVMDTRSISSRSSSESSPQASYKRLDFIRHNMGSLDLQSTPDCTPPVSPSSFLFQKNRQKQGLNFTLNNDLTSSTFSIEPGSLFESLPLSKPRSFSSPNTDSSEYENVQNAASHYENVQIRLLNPVIQSQRNQSSTNDTDGYVDMSSLPGFQSKSQSSEQETDSLYTFCSPNVRVDGTVGVSVGVACTQEKKTKASDKLTVNCSRAFYCAKELLDSEAQHVKTLQLLCESVEADERLMTVWTEVPDICTLHQNIHTLLETRLKEWDQNEGIAEIILAKKKEFSIFSSYISHYDEKLNYLEHIQSTLLDAVTLKKQLLQVIVRILQYRMLLTDYLNNLSPDSIEFENTQDALVVVSDIAYRANDSLKNGADLLRLVHIEHSVLGLTDLLQPGRVFVKEGTLMKVSRKCKQPRHLFLMNDIMLYTYPQQDGKYRLINRLPLAGMEISKPPIENSQSALKIEVKDISITLSASSCIERDSWFVTLNRTLVDLGPASGDLVGCFELVEGPEMCLGENAPPLLSVSQVTVCMNCPSHFSLTNRRHHCHACGKVVCRDCCRNKFPLKYMKNRRAKVCDHCYTELRKNDVATITESSSRPLSAVFQNIHPSSLWKSRKGQMSFNQETGSEGVMSGTLQRCKNSKRSWRSLWFLLKDKVLYTYPQPEERVACETLPLLGFSVRSEVEEESSMFHLYHKSTLFYTFRAQDSHTAQRWVNAMEEATVL
ncbi:FYVE, RhoGEF and PH domain-containing protein 5 isoform X1 [Megalobrama amblycephala]|uniref:FYVE, RhoGEF and PH domain-containing protein 5 isoform X1 n=2 Tax=Megalobrama amblycephala TaxID=75352 RepID=UPI0020142C7B|nr:FYVE, RhoGEF and PH domain-containing protein 5 isoform X1 [Megalobrama amblycephala]XP_048055348.1 FYVE, RhoGEF and PH domain-containing protein 5 isoform X1 [Megalobrama amblycephala]